MRQFATLGAVTGVILAGWCLRLGLFGQPALTPTQQSPRLSVRNTDLGVLYSGTADSRSVELTNHESTPVLVKSIRPSCSCSKVESSFPVAIAPGETEIVRLSLDMTGEPSDSLPHPFELGLGLVIGMDGRKDSVVNASLSAQVQPGYRLAPASLEMRRIAGTFHAVELDLFPEMPIVRLSASVDIEQAQAVVTQDVDRFQILVRPSEGVEVVPESFQVRLAAELSDGRRIAMVEAPVRVAGAISWYPRVLQFGAVRSGERAAETLNFYCDGPEKFRVVSIESSNPDLIEVDSDTADYSPRQVATVSVQAEPSLDVSGRIRVHFELESSEVEIVDIPVSVLASASESAVQSIQSSRGQN
jgi:hypothetical protein